MSTNRRFPHDRVDSVLIASQLHLADGCASTRARFPIPCTRCGDSDAVLLDRRAVLRPREHSRSPSFGRPGQGARELSPAAQDRPVAHSLRARVREGRRSGRLGRHRQRIRVHEGQVRRAVRQRLQVGRDRIVEDDRDPRLREGRRDRSPLLRDARTISFPARAAKRRTRCCAKRSSAPASSASARSRCARTRCTSPASRPSATRSCSRSCASPTSSSTSTTSSSRRQTRLGRRSSRWPSS